MGATVKDFGLDCKTNYSCSMTWSAEASKFSMLKLTAINL